MATTKPFAINTGEPISGTTQIGDIAIGTTAQNYAASPGGVTWYMGPNEEDGYIIAGKNGSAPTFWRSAHKTSQSLLSLINTIGPGLGASTFNSIADAKAWLTENGYYCSHSNSSERNCGLIVNREIGEENWTYYVIDWDNNTISDSVDTGLNTDDYNRDFIYVIQDGGYLLAFRNSSDYNIFVGIFMDAEGSIIETVNIESNNIGADLYAGRWVTLFDVNSGDLWWFDGASLNHSSSIFVDANDWGFGTNEDSISSNGIILYRAIDNGDDPDTIKYSILNNNGITDIYTYTYSIDGSYFVNAFAYLRSDKILFTEYDDNTGYYIGFKIYSLGESPELLQSETLSVDTYSNYTYNAYGEDNISIMFWNSSNPGVDYQIYFYKGVSDSLLYTTHNFSNYPSYNLYGNRFYNNDLNNYPTTDNYLIIFYQSGTDVSGLTGLLSCSMVYIFDTGNIEQYTFQAPTDIATKGISFYEINWTSDVFFIPVDSGDGNYKILKLAKDSDETGNYITKPYAYLDIDYWYLETVGEGLLLVVYLNDGNSSYTKYNNIGGSPIVLTSDVENDDVNYSNDTIVATFFSSDKYYLTRTSTEWTLASNYQGLNDSGYYYHEDNIVDPYILLTKSNRIYWFNDIGNNYISDGGNDMYDNGNYINTNLGSEIPYTHTQMTDTGDMTWREVVSVGDFPMDGAIVSGDTSNFGDGSSYFTNLYPGLFVLSADSISITNFNISGGLGSDGGGDQDFYTISSITNNSHTYTAYIKRQWGSTPGEPNVNHIIIVNSDGSGITHTINEDTTDLDTDAIEGSIPTKLHYLVVSKFDCVKITDTEIENIISSYLSIVDNLSISSFAEVLAALNTNYGGVTDNLPPRDSDTNDCLFLDSTGPHTFSLPSFIDISIGDNYIALFYYDLDRDGKITFQLYDLEGELIGTAETEEYMIFDFNIVGAMSFITTMDKHMGDIEYTIFTTYIIGSGGAHNKAISTISDPPFCTFNDYLWWDD